MPINGYETICREYHFDRGGSIGEFTSATNGTGAISYTANTTKGVQLSATATSDRAYLHFNGRLLFPIDNLLLAEYFFQISAWDDTTDGFLGFGSAYNADPDAIQESVNFRIAGGSTGRNLSVETDDNVTNIDDEAAGIVIPNDSWIRATINFATGIQSIGPPGSSKGGKSSIKFTCTDESGYQQHIVTTKHMDMSAYAGGLQPIFGLRQLTADAAGAVSLFVKKLKVEYRSPA